MCSYIDDRPSAGLLVAGVTGTPLQPERAQEDSAVLRKKAATSSGVASNPGSPKMVIALIGTKSKASPAAPDGRSEGEVLRPVPGRFPGVTLPNRARQRKEGDLLVGR
jgi:hypothetical protein